MNTVSLLESGTACTNISVGFLGVCVGDSGFVYDISYVKLPLSYAVFSL